MKVAPMKNLLARLGNATSIVKRPGTPKSKAKPRRYESKLRPRSRVSNSDATEVDRILDKINEHGLQSLTEEERLLLTRAGKR
jgi:hypothetical protein